MTRRQKYVMLSVLVCVLDSLALLLSLAEQEDTTEVCKYSGDSCSRWAQTLSAQ